MIAIDDPTRWQQVRALFERCADLPEREWPVELQRACPDQPQLRALALEMLVADQALSTLDDTATIPAVLRDLPGLAGVVPGIDTLRCARDRARD